MEAAGRVRGCRPPLAAQPCRSRFTTSADLTDRIPGFLR